MPGSQYVDSGGTAGRRASARAGLMLEISIVVMVGHNELDSVLLEQEDR